MRSQILIAFLSALAVGGAQFAWNQADRAAERLYWAQYVAGLERR